VPGLDEVLNGGLLAGRLYLVDGNPGAGKTTLALQYLLCGVAAGERCTYVTLSETREELEASAASHGWALDGIDVVELIADPGELVDDAALTMFHPSEVELTETTRKVLAAVERHRPQRLVFDSLSELRLLAQHSLRYRRQILALKQFFAGRGCTVLLLDDRTAEGPDLQLQSIAHGVMSLDHVAPAYGPAQRQLRVVKFRGSGFSSGHQDVVIRRGGLVVYPRLTALEHRSEFVREAVPSGVDRLDALLGGGVDRGTTTLLVGAPGTGKSTVAAQYASAAASRGAHAAIFSFEESTALLRARCEGLGIAMPLGVGPGTVRVRHVYPTEILPGQLSAMVRDAVEAGGARVVVLDSLNGYLNALPSEKALTTQLHELLSYLANHGVATFLVAAQSGLVGAATRAPIDASYLADAVVTFRLFEHQGRLKRAISAVKKRGGWHEETIREIWFDATGVHLGEPLLHLRGVLTGVPVEVGVAGTVAGVVGDGA
jgi:circadian clock protein KaiC